MHKHNSKTLFATSLAISLAVLTACGGDDGDGGGGAKCGGEACGGDVVGTWEIKESCFSGDALNQMDMTCSGSVIDSSDIKMTGTLMFKADKTYTADTVANGTMKMTMPASCFKEEGGPSLTCAQVGAFLTAFAALGDGGLTAECTGSTTCSCKMKMTNFDVGKEGTYVLNGNRITRTTSDDDEEPETSDYCAKDGKLSLALVPAPGATGTASIQLNKK